MHTHHTTPQGPYHGTGGAVDGRRPIIYIQSAVRWAATVLTAPVEIIGSRCHELVGFIFQEFFCLGRISTQIERTTLVIKLDGKWSSCQRRRCSLQSAPFVGILARARRDPMLSTFVDMLVGPSVNLSWGVNLCSQLLLTCWGRF